MATTDTITDFKANTYGQGTGGAANSKGASTSSTDWTGDIGFGAGAASRRPMGIAVIGGMLTSTILTLVVIPVVYTLFSDTAGWLAARFRSRPRQNPWPRSEPSLPCQHPRWL